MCAELSGARQSRKNRDGSWRHLLGVGLTALTVGVMLLGSVHDASGREKVDHSTVETFSFHVEGSHGYSVGVLASDSSIRVDVSGRDGIVAYAAPISESNGEFHGRLGTLGRIDMRFTPRGHRQRSLEPGSCPRRAVVQHGVFEGMFWLHGELGMTKVKTTRVAGLRIRSPHEVCQEPADDHRATWLEVQSSGPRGAIGFEAIRSSGGQVAVLASIMEVRPRLRIERVSLASGEFQVDRSMGLVEIYPSGEFSGSAMASITKDGITDWRGDLSTNFPGRRGEVRLTGKKFRIRGDV